jgi:hypothetical protein
VNTLSILLAFCKALHPGHPVATLSPLLLYGLDVFGEEMMALFKMCPPYIHPCGGWMHPVAFLVTSGHLTRSTFKIFLICIHILALDLIKVKCKIISMWN